MIELVPILAAVVEHSATVPAVEVPVPVYVGWIGGFLLPILWLFIGAVVIGPVVYFFKLEPRSSQMFIDDKRSAHSH